MFAPSRVLQESMFGYHNQLAGSGLTEPSTTPSSNTNFELPVGENFEVRPTTLDTDLAKALLLSEQEQRDRQLEAEREQQMFEEVLRLSLEEKWTN